MSNTAPLVTTIAVPGIIGTLASADQQVLDDLLRRFNSARRRAYQLYHNGHSSAMIERLLQEDHGLNGRYAKDALQSIKPLPAHVTFGGKYNQLLRAQHKISASEYRKRRNNLLYSRGEKTKIGNLNTRLDLPAHTLRINTGVAQPKYLVVSIFIPRKYLLYYRQYLNGTVAYTIMVTRRENDAGFSLRVLIEVSCFPHPRIETRVLALDVNAGHTDFAILDIKTLHLLCVGRFNHPGTQDCRHTKRKALILSLIDKIGNLAQNYQATVVTGKMDTREVSHKPRSARRKIRQLPQYQFRQLLVHQLTKRGIPVHERSEAYTSVGGRYLVPLLGLDIHKCAAILFALKITYYSMFRQLVMFLRDRAFHDGHGNPKKSRSGVTPNSQGLPVLLQKRRPNSLAYLHESARMTFWGTMTWWWQEWKTHHPGVDLTIPGSQGLAFLTGLKSNLTYLTLQIT